MRPLFQEEGASAETKVIGFPATVEAMGRGLDLLQNGISLFFSISSNIFMNVLHRVMLIYILW